MVWENSYLLMVVVLMANGSKISSMAQEQKSFQMDKNTQGVL